MPHPLMMTAADTGLLVVDVQKKLMDLIPGHEAIAKNVVFLVDAAKLLGVPVQATEQYPKGLGSSISEVVERVSERPEKTAFTCCAIPSVVEQFRRQARPKVLVVGIEAHVCIQQTVLDLLNLDFRVFVAVDAVASRGTRDRDTAIERMRDAGAVITTTESAVFEWLGGSHHPQFKQISKMIQERDAGGRA